MTTSDIKKTPYKQNSTEQKVLVILTISASKDRYKSVVTQREKETELESKRKATQ